MDFTLSQYTRLLNTLVQAGFSFPSFEDYRNPSQTPNPESPLVILRHDVDLLPQNSLQTALIENRLGIKGSYYFRIVKESNDPQIIEQIRELGHEIGYHYEDLTLAGGNFEKAYDSFTANLEYFRRFYSVKTICMHGSPMSKWDSRDIWKKYNYRDLGIIGEPYFDIDFSKVAYYTDTGRMWNGNKYSVRDKISNIHNTSVIPHTTPTPSGGKAGRGAFPTYRSTPEIITALKNNTFPPQAMLTLHPQRWTDKPLPWAKELILQGAKNVVKRWFFVNPQRPV